MIIKTNLPNIFLVGISSNANNSDKADRIGITMQKYFSDNISEQIQNKKNPGVIFSVYTNYESNFNGDYTYFIGEEVTSFENIDKNLTTLSIPSQNYIKFTTESGELPNIVIDQWKNIWKMESENNLEGKRSYIADFEIYDERCHDLQNAIVDIYIGIK
jgi:predicted transcriptional regulator YdeE